MVCGSNILGLDQYWERLKITGFMGIWAVFLECTSAIEADPGYFGRCGLQACT
jgi:hypothetical protein